MASSLARASAQDILKLITGQATSVYTTTPPTNLYLGLVVSGAAATTIGTECSGTSYARIQTVGNWAAVVSATPCSVTNSADLSFPAAGHASNWGTLTQAVLIGHITNATPFIAWGDLAASKTPGLGDVIRFAAGTLILTLI